MNKDLKISDFTFADIEIFFKDGGSMIISHKGFLELFESIKNGYTFHVVFEEPLENQKVPVGLIKIDLIKFTKPVLKTS